MRESAHASCSRDLASWRTEDVFLGADRWYSVYTLNAHYRTCNLTPKHVCAISHTHFRTCTALRKRYDYSYLRAVIASLRKGERSGRCSPGLLHTGATSMGNGSCSLGQSHNGATSMGSDTTSVGGYNCGTTMAGIVRLKRWKADVMWEMKANKHSVKICCCQYV